MAKFCRKCGLKVDDKAKKCPRCGNDMSKGRKNEINGGGKSGSSSRSTREKVKRFFLKLIVIILIILILVIGIAGVLLHFDIIKLPFLNSNNEPQNIEEVQPVAGSGETKPLPSPDPYEVESIDAEEYFNNNSKVIASFDAATSSNVTTEAETYTNLTGRGFSMEPITTSFDVNGNFLDEVEISGSSSTKHPMYVTVYITQGGDFWSIVEINGKVFAYPISYNSESTLGVPTMISESDTVISYDGVTNKFFEISPYASTMIVKTVDRIDAETIEKLTKREIDAL